MKTNIFNNVFNFIKDAREIIFSLSFLIAYCFNKCDDEWDKKINELMDNHDFKVVGYNDIVINGINIWYNNYPYKFGHSFDYGEDDKFGIVYNSGRPRLRTILRIKRKILLDTDIDVELIEKKFLDNLFKYEK